MQCTLEELVDSTNYTKPLRYEGADFGKIFIKSEKLQAQKGGKKGGKKGKKGGAVGGGKKKIENESVIGDTKEMTAIEDDTFKSIPPNMNDTAMTQAFTPGRYTPTKDQEEEADETIGGEGGEGMFVSTTEGLRQEEAGEDDVHDTSPTKLLFISYLSTHKWCLVVILYYLYYKLEMNVVEVVR
eukprot:sb/3471485/